MHHRRKRRQLCDSTARIPHRSSRRHANSTRSQSAKRSSLRHTPALPAKRTEHSEATTVDVTTGPPPTTATIASVLAVPCQNADLTPEVGNLEQVQTATLCLVNQERARNNELPLQPNAQLAQAAQQHSKDMVGEDYFAHIAPNGETPLDRVQASGYIPNSQVGYTVGENIAWGTLYLATPSSIVAAWTASPEHLANILNASYRDTAVGVAPSAPPSLADGLSGAVYTQELGVIQG
ncbi:MAG: CAP domain-containing protein [Solirubrobacteraceae bacterium]